MLSSSPVPTIKKDERIAQLTLFLQWMLDKNKRYTQRLSLQTNPLADRELVMALDHACQQAYPQLIEAQALDVNLAKQYSLVFQQLQQNLMTACQNCLIFSETSATWNPDATTYIQLIMAWNAIYQLDLFPTEAAQLSQNLKILEDSKINWNKLYQRLKQGTLIVKPADDFNHSIDKLIETQKSIYHHNFVRHHVSTSSNLGTLDQAFISRLRKSLQQTRKFDLKSNDSQFQQSIDELTQKLNKSADMDLTSESSSPSSSCSTSTLLTQLSAVKSNPLLAKTNFAVTAESEFFGYNKITLSEEKPTDKSTIKKVLVFDMDETLAYYNSDTSQAVLISADTLIPLLKRIDLTTTEVGILTSRYYPEIESVKFTCHAAINFIHQLVGKDVFKWIIYMSTHNKKVAMLNEYRTLLFHDPALTRANMILVDNIEKPNLEDVKAEGFTGILADFEGSHIEAIAKTITLTPTKAEEILAPTCLSSSPSPK